MPTPNSPTRLNLLFLGLTLMLVGYFLVWLPGPSAGLQIIGIELGEWIKFLGARARRDWFYLPPIAIGLILALITALWPNDRAATWGMRALAVAVALLAFPAVAAVQLEPSSEWLARLLLIGGVGVAAVGAAVASRRGVDARWVWGLVAVAALVGVALPTAQYFAVRPVAEGILRRAIGIGPGVWLNAAGGLLVLVVAAAGLRRGRK